MRKLKKYAGLIEQKDGPEKFQAEFLRMERRVTELAERYRRTRLNIKDLVTPAIFSGDRPILRRPRRIADLPRGVADLFFWQNSLWACGLTYDF